VNADELQAACLSFPGAWEGFPFGEQPSVFKVGPKMFALSRLDGEPRQVSLKCEPQIGEDLRASYGAINPGYHLNKRHWITVTLDGSIDDAVVRDLIEDSYDLVVAKMTARERADVPGL
jgi:predicted DNA-binding protein (MmcQ/YjbR family)